MIKGIDVSSWQGLIDFDKVREDDICFCIVKAGGSDAKTPYIDKRFYENIARATKAGIPCGAYYFVGKHCTNYEAGRADAERFERIIRSVRLLFPVYIRIPAEAR
jgi:GH25 family lysozyme M1 (1,4-beta-N-acetylmuramidase)